jgi:hypothetical protein
MVATINHTDESLKIETKLPGFYGQSVVKHNKTLLISEVIQMENLKAVTPKQEELLNKLLKAWDEINEEADSDSNFDEVLTRYEITGTRQRENIQAELYMTIDEISYHTLTGFQELGVAEKERDGWMHPDDCDYDFVDIVDGQECVNCLFWNKKGPDGSEGTYLFKQYGNFDQYDLTSYVVYFKTTYQEEPPTVTKSSHCNQCGIMYPNDLMDEDGYCIHCTDGDLHHTCPKCASAITEQEHNENRCELCAEDDGQSFPSNRAFKCTGCNHHQYGSEFGECFECGREDLVVITEAEFLEWYSEEDDKNNPEPKKQNSYDIEFQLFGMDVWLRVNDNLADNEEQAMHIAFDKLIEQMGIDLNDPKYDWQWECPNIEFND